MTRLPLVIGLFLSVTVTGMVFLLSLVAQVTYQTMLYRSFVVFFLFGLLGVGLGSLLEIVLMPFVQAKEEDKLKKELQMENPRVVEDLGDLLAQPPGKRPPRPASNGNVAELDPVVLPRATVEKPTVAHGNSTVVS